MVWWKWILWRKSGKPKNEGVTGHFTQVIWKESTELGFGVAKSSDSSIYVVANYHPGGNFNNLEKDNVNYYGHSFGLIKWKYSWK